MQNHQISTIKIQMGKKIFHVRGLKNFSELQSNMRQKFRLADLSEYQMSYFDSKKDQIYIESDEDLQIAQELQPTDLRIVLRKEPQKSPEEVFLTNEHLVMFGDFLKQSLPCIGEEVREIIEADQIPCKECFFEKGEQGQGCEDDSFYSQDTCVKCKGTRRRNLDNTWRLILFLIDYKIKELILQPIQNFNHLQKEGSPGKKTTFLSEKSSKHYRDPHSSLLNSEREGEEQEQGVKKVFGTIGGQKKSVFQVR